MRYFFTLLTLCLGVTLSAQAEQFVDSVNLNGLPLQILLEDVTSTPIVIQQYSFVGLNPMNGDSLWSVERKALSGIAQKMSDDHDEATDVVDIPDVPYIFVNGVLVDVRSGEKLIDESENVKLFRASYFFEEEGVCLIEVSLKGGIRLYAFEVASGKRMMAVETDLKPGLDNLAGNRAAESGKDPVILDRDNILYYDAQNLYHIDLAAGKINWKYDGKVYDSRVVNDGKNLLLLFPPGLISLADYGKEFHLLDMVTGEPLTKKRVKLDGAVKTIEPYDGGLAIVHTKGMNIFDYDDSGEGRWSKDFAEGGISSFEVTNGEMAIYYKNKKMMVDPATGKAKTKKPEKLDREPYAGAAPKAVFDFAGKEVKMWGSNKIEIDGEQIFFSQIAFDAARKMIVTAKVNETNANLKKEVYYYDFEAYDITTKSKVTMEGRFAFSSGMAELEIIGDRVIAYSHDGLTVLTSNLEFGELVHDVTYKFNAIQRKGAKTAKRIGRLLGGSSDEEDLTEVPGYLKGDYVFYNEAKAEGFAPAVYPASPAKVHVLLGTPVTQKYRMPLLAVFEKASGEFVMQDRMIYDNAQFTLDPEKNQVYVIHGKSIRWYRF